MLLNARPRFQRFRPISGVDNFELVFIRSVGLIEGQQAVSFRKDVSTASFFHSCFISTTLPPYSFIFRPGIRRGNAELDYSTRLTNLGLILPKSRKKIFSRNIFDFYVSCLLNTILVFLVSFVVFVSEALLFTFRR